MLLLNREKKGRFKSGLQLVFRRAISLPVFGLYKKKPSNGFFYQRRRQ
jgi:hypothetical protein